MKHIYFAFCFFLSVASFANEPTEHYTFSVTVRDKNSNAPLELVHVLLRTKDGFLRVGTTDPTGIAVFREIDPGQYTLTTRRLGYAEVVQTVSIDATHTTFSVQITEVTLQGKDVVVTGETISNVSAMVDTKTGNQTLEGETYHPAPTAQATSLLQENVAGAVRAPTGEVHVRGMHGEYTYYLDGCPIPLGVFGGLNDIVDSKTIERATFLTGGFPAEYGGQTAAVIELQTRVPSGRFHLDASTYGGSYLASGDNLGDRVGSFKGLNANGQSLSLSDHSGNFGFLLSGSRQETDRRIDQPVETLSHDHGFDYFLYGKGSYILSDNDYLATNLNYSVTQTEIPFDSAEGVALDNQNTFNAFQTLSYFHSTSTGTENESNFFAGLFAREGGVHFDPSTADDNKQFLPGDTVHGYVVEQHRSFTTLGLRSKYDVRFSHEFNVAAGAQFGVTSGTEDFLFKSDSANGPETKTNFSGSDFPVSSRKQRGILRNGQHSISDCVTTRHPARCRIATSTLSENKMEFLSR